MGCGLPGGEGCEALADDDMLGVWCGVRRDHDVREGERFVVVVGAIWGLGEASNLRPIGLTLTRHKHDGPRFMQSTHW